MVIAPTAVESSKLLFADFRRRLMSSQKTLAQQKSVDPLVWFSSIFDIPLAPFQREIFLSVLDMNIRYLLILAPPGHRKSTAAIAGLTYLLGTQEVPRAVVASYDSDYSEAFLNQICQILRTPSSRFLLGDIIPDGIEQTVRKWASDERYFPGQTYISKDPTLKAVGAKSGTVGTRTPFIYADDVVTIPNSSTPIQRRHLKDWFTGGLLNRLEHNGRVVVVGQRYFDGDLYGDLAAMSTDKEGTWKVLSYSATPDKPLWPEYYDGARLLDIYRNDPVFFPATYMQEPLKQNAAMLKVEWIQFYIPTVLNTDSMPKFLGVDPCKSGHDDEMAICIVAYDGERIYVLAYVTAQGDLEEQVALVRHCYRLYDAALVNVEEDLMVSTALAKCADMRVRSSPSLISKELRFKTLGSLALKGLMLWPGKLTENNVFEAADEMSKFVEQWRYFPSGGVHDDLLDCTEKAAEAVTHGIEPAMLKIETKDSRAEQRRHKHDKELVFYKDIGRFV